MTSRLLSDDAAVAEFLRVIIPPRERRRRAVYFVLCRGLQPVQPCALDEPIDLASYAIAQCVEPFTTVLSEVPDGRLLVAMCRPGRGTPIGLDHRWFERVHSVCRRRDVPVIGFWLATPGGERPLPLSDGPSAAVAV